MKVNFMNKINHKKILSDLPDCSNKIKIFESLETYVFRKKIKI